MFPDNTLTPKEATRLCALGTLSAAPMRYSVLATAVRHFIGRILGTSIDLMAPSIELLKYEGLVRPVSGSGMEDNAELAITDKGRTELRTLLTANLRSGATELNKLVVSLKFRFLHLLEPAERQAQIEMLMDVCEEEIARLHDLKQAHEADSGYLGTWLEHDIGQLEVRLAWLDSLAKS
jgi:hypothetical protein